ncbi:MAG: hypothetical protein PVJ27_07285 [Candidatus Brocadiaceae bacterium]|jgi:hypothetical protein
MALKALISSLAVVLVSLAFCAGPVRADRPRLVLLDEYWSPEITQNGTVVEEVDAEKTGDPTQAVSGYFSARVVNEWGAPNVRFRNGPALRIGDLAPGQTEARLWYRTDNFNGNLRLEIWVHTVQAGRPIGILQADLDGGGEDGRLIADDRWHPARGVLRKAEEYGMAPADGFAGTSWVWLRATEGWDIAHRTYVDRIELLKRGEALAPGALPVRHVRPMPGAQESGPGFIWWEAEDALEKLEPPRDNFAPSDAAHQRLLSNGTWVLKARKTDLDPMSYRVETDQAGAYALWGRGYWKGGSFRWRWDGGEWRTSAPGVASSHEVMFVGEWMPVGWAHLGQVRLSPGVHTFEVEGLQTPVGLGFDCWVLARDAFGAPPEGGAAADQTAEQ